MMATTTSTDNTGLLDYLAPEFKKDTGIELKWIAVGTGKALQLGKNCDVDVLLVHDPDAEKEFMTGGYGINRKEIMYNDFVIIGPKNDPAGIKKMTVAKAMKAIADKKATFTSRGDKSGTHALELKLWESSGINTPDKESWYLQTGQGMIETIKVASEKNGYTITDRGTYIKYETTMKGNPPLVILVDKDTKLFNQYAAIEVDPTKCHKVKNDLAKEYIKWMSSPKGQKLIKDFKLEGKQLFTPNAKK
jgi:tungstate transport system substrate-binding protein